MDGYDGDVGELIREFPERYMIVPFDGGTEGEIFIADNGGKVIIVRADYPRQGLCVVDTEGVRDMDIGKMTDSQSEGKARLLNDNDEQGTETEILKVFDYLLEEFGAMTVCRVRQEMANNGGGYYTEIEFRRLPFTFKGGNAEACFKKLIEFTIDKYKDLVPVFENKELRQKIRGAIKRMITEDDLEEGY